MFKLNGKIIRAGEAFTGPDGVQHPANWHLWDAARRAEIGIVEIAEDPRPNDRFYYVDGPDLDGKYTKTPKDLAELKKMLIGELKAAAGSILTQTDWKVIRGAEGGKPLDQATKDFRKSVRDASDAREAAINACTTVAELEALPGMQWPTL